MAWRIGSKPKVAPPQRSVAHANEASLPKVARDFYLEHPEVAALSKEQADALRSELGIRVQGDGCPNPVSSFLQASFPQYVLDVLAGANYTAPTAIQRQAWPIAMQGQDLVGLAETGSGKTLAFLLQALVHVNAQPVLEEGDGPLAVVLAPTRELAVQIHEECVRFGHPCGVSTICIYGGVPKQAQVMALRKAPEIMIATPGRLTDLLAGRKTELSRCTCAACSEYWRIGHSHTLLRPFSFILTSPPCPSRSPPPRRLLHACSRPARDKPHASLSYEQLRRSRRGRPDVGPGL